MPRPSILLFMLAALLLGAGMLMAATRVAAQVSQPAAVRVQQPVIEKARGDQCVEEPAVIRRTHMALLKHQRDETVHLGIRGSCHSYAAVKIDCFECHSSKP